MNYNQLASHVLLMWSELILAHETLGSVKHLLNRLLVGGSGSRHLHSLPGNSELIRAERHLLPRALVWNMRCQGQIQASQPRHPEAQPVTPAHVEAVHVYFMSNCSHFIFGTLGIGKNKPM